MLNVAVIGVVVGFKLLRLIVGQKLKWNLGGYGCRRRDEGGKLVISYRLLVTGKGGSWELGKGKNILLVIIRLLSE